MRIVYQTLQNFASPKSKLFTLSFSVLNKFLHFVNIFFENTNCISSDSNCNPFENDELSPQQDKAQHEIIRQCNFKKTDIIDARLSGKQSLLHTAQHQTSAVQTTSSDNSEPANVERKSYTTMLQLIAGSIIGESVYTQIYDDLDNNQDSEDTCPSSNKFVPPTLSGIARKAAKVENKILDKKQYIAYEIICCTFMLGLIRDGKDTSTLLSRCLGQCLDECPQTTNDPIEELKARGGEDQTLMFLTGPAIHCIHRTCSIPFWWCYNSKTCLPTKKRTFI